MKTTIDISQFNFGNRQLTQQISDDPQTGFARVIVFDRFEVKDDIKQLVILGRMYYINQETNTLLPKFIHVALSQGKEWIVDNNYENVKLDMNGEPVPNLAYDSETPISEDNFPYLKAAAYDNFSKIMFALLSPLVSASVLQDDSKGYFNEKTDEGNDW